MPATRQEGPYVPDVLRLSILLTIVVGTSRVHQHYPFMMAMRPALVAFGVGVAYAVLVPRSIDLRNLTRSWTTAALGGLALCAALSIPFGISLGASASRFIGGYAQTLLTTALMVVAIRDWRDLRFMLFAFFIAFAILIWLSLYVFDVAQASSGIDRLVFDYAFDGNDIGVILVMGIPLALVLFHGRSTVLKLLVLAGMGAALVVVARTGSRGAFVGLAGVGVTLVFLAKHVRLGLRILMPIAAVVVLALAAPPGYWEQMRTIVQPQEDYNLQSQDGRLQIAKRGIEYMMRYPFFGVGIGNFGRAEGTISSKARSHLTGEQLMWTAPHNTLIEVGAELGLPALVLWLSLLAAGTAGLALRRARLPANWRHGDDEQRFLYFMTTYLPAAYIGFAATTFFLSFTYNQQFYLLFAYLTGLHILTERRSRKDARMRTGSPVPLSDLPARGTSHWRVRRQEQARLLAADPS
jgi:hypothetical protein